MPAPTLSPTTARLLLASCHPMGRRPESRPRARCLVRPGRPAMTASTGESRPDPLLTIEDVAAWLGKPKNTLYAWHSRGKGPRAIRVGNSLRYRRSEVDHWLDAHTDTGR
jgi:excisionase family DNA binding protein